MEDFTATSHKSIWEVIYLLAELRDSTKSWHKMDRPYTGRQSWALIILSLNKCSVRRAPPGLGRLAQG